MKRRRQTPHLHKKASTVNSSSCNTLHATPRIILVLLLMLQRENSCLALLPNISRGKYSPNSVGSFPSKIGGWTTIFSPLFAGTASRLQLHRSRRQEEYFAKASSSATALKMVLTTPESIIEQASTINLLDDLIDESVRTSPRRPIMMQFDPSSGWIWRRWKGTIFSETWTSCVKNMVYASIIFFIYKQYPGVKEYLNGFGTLWGQLLSVTTFTLTFFVNQSYALWRKCYELSRRLQGRLHDIGMNLATHATRKVPNTPEEKSTYTAASRQILELMSRYIRLFDLLTYASFTRSHRPILTPRGMRRLVERGLMTAQEREVLIDAAIPATQRHSAILMWMIRLFVEGRSSGHIQGGDGFEQQTMEKFHIIRAQYGAIGDELQGRMPLAYAHVVQILVDLILWMYPVMAFSISMSPIVAILGTGLLTLSYQGLFDLAKQFLDPYDNENYGKGEDPLSVDTLIAETNAGSVRWMYGFEEMPFSQEKLREGELYEYLLPVRGYSVEEVAEMEEEKLKRKKELKEKLFQEEQERVQREAEEARISEEGGDSDDETQDEVGDGDYSDNDESFPGSVATIEEHEAKPEVEDRQVHTVTTLGYGTAVSFKEPPAVLIVPPENVASQLSALDPGVPSGVAPYLATLSREVAFQQDAKESKSPINDQTVDLIDCVELQELPDNELAAPGDDIPMNAILGKEDVMGATEMGAVTLSFEEYEAKSAESGGIFEVEGLEKTVTVIDLPASFVKGKRRDDGSQPANRESSEKVDKPLMQVQSSNISELNLVESNDGPALTDERNSLDVEGTDVTYKGMENISSKKDTLQDTPTSALGKSEDDPPNDGSVSKDADARESRKAEPPARLTLGDFKEQVEKIMEAAKQEVLETEAILKARPGADPLGWDYDDKQLAPSTDGSEVDEKNDLEEPDVNEDAKYDNSDPDDESDYHL